MRNLNKRAAMFGLDARIALAIFGALSIISGAALYSAIKAVKVEQWRQRFEELTKASEQYYLDNGKQLPKLSGRDDKLYFADLVVNRKNLASWQGPYWSASYAIAGDVKDELVLSVHSSAFSGMVLRQSSTWSSMDDMDTDEHCIINSSDCSEWYTVSANHSSATTTLLQLFNDLDLLVDRGDGALSGKVRYNTYSLGYLMYQGIPHKKTY